MKAIILSAIAAITAGQMQISGQVPQIPAQMPPASTQAGQFSFAANGQIAGASSPFGGVGAFGQGASQVGAAAFGQGAATLQFPGQGQSQLGASAIGQASASFQFPGANSMSFPSQGVNQARSAALPSQTAQPAGQTQFQAQGQLSSQFQFQMPSQMSSFGQTPVTQLPPMGQAPVTQLPPMGQMGQAPVTQLPPMGQMGQAPVTQMPALGQSSAMSQLSALGQSPVSQLPAGAQGVLSRLQALQGQGQLQGQVQGQSPFQGQLSQFQTSAMPQIASQMPQSGVRSAQFQLPAQTLPGQTLAAQPQASNPFSLYAGQTQGKIPTGSMPYSFSGQFSQAQGQSGFSYPGQVSQSQPQASSGDRPGYKTIWVTPDQVASTLAAHPGAVVTDVITTRL